MGTINVNVWLEEGTDPPSYASVKQHEVANTLVIILWVWASSSSVKFI